MDSHRQPRQINGAEVVDLTGDGGKLYFPATSTPLYRSGEAKPPLRNPFSVSKNVGGIGAPEVVELSSDDEDIGQPQTLRTSAVGQRSDASTSRSDSTRIVYRKRSPSGLFIPRSSIPKGNRPYLDRPIQPRPGPILSGEPQPAARPSGMTDSEAFSTDPKLVQKELEEPGYIPGYEKSPPKTNSTQNSIFKTGRVSGGEPLMPRRLVPNASDQGRSKSERPAEAWTCNNCAEDGLRCDGEQPCSRCSEPGFECLFVGRPAKTSRPNIILRVGQRSKTSTKTASSESAAAEAESSASCKSLHRNVSHSYSSQSTPQKDSPLSDFSVPEQTTPDLRTDKTESHEPSSTKVGSNYNEENDRGLNHAEHTEGKSPQTIVVPDVLLVNGKPLLHDVVLTPASVEEVIHKYQEQTNANRELVVKSLLRQARLDCRKLQTPVLSDNDANPFGHLESTSLPNETDATNLSSKKYHLLQLRSKTFSNGVAQHSQWKAGSVSVRDFCVATEIIPRYKSIGHVGPSLLSRNYRTMKYLPYYVENEYASEANKKESEELEEQYRKEMPRLLGQRKCQEIASLWRPGVASLLRDLNISPSTLCYYFLHAKDKLLQLNLSDASPAAYVDSTRHLCPTCKIDDHIGKALSRTVAAQSQEPPSRPLALAGLLSSQFRHVAKVNLWHIICSSKSVRNFIRQNLDRPGQRNALIDGVLCLVCYRHHCSTHGAFIEPEVIDLEEEDDENDDDDDDDDEVKAGRLGVCINDPEKSNNDRLHVGFQSQGGRMNEHLCGVFCCDSGLSPNVLLGQQEDGKVLGHSRCPSLVSDSEFLKDSEFCSDKCFWNVRDRDAKFQRIGDISLAKVENVSSKQAAMMNEILPLLASHRRGPCLLSMAVQGVTCMDAFYYMVAATNQVPHDPKIHAVDDANAKAKLKPNLSRDEFSRTLRLDERPPFVPCSHTGPCEENQGCSCSDEKIVCEWSCNCDKTCRRRYEGCTCRSGNSRVCFNDERCECWRLNRECDPHLCGSCGVTEVLDPENRYDVSKRRDRCKNSRLQLDLPRRTLKAPSEVQGWGLFAGENIPEGEYIGEYKGEIISTQESDRRGAIYHNIELEYLFIINRDQQVDGSNVGNKTRLMNNSQRKEHINVVARKMLCNGVQRVMLYAKRSIKAGEELLYTYNYPPEVLKNFWEKGERPVKKQNAQISTAHHSAKQTRAHGRFAKSSDAPSPRIVLGDPVTDDEKGTDRSQSPPLPGNKKRKRTLDAEAIEARPSPKAACEEGLVALDDSEFEVSNVLFEESTSEDHLEGGEEESDYITFAAPRRKVRQRKISSTDGRLGGKAQRKAWQTRQANLRKAAALHAKRSTP